MQAALKLIYDTAKVRLGFLITACTLTGVAISPANDLAAWQLVVLGLATLVASSAAGAFNQFYERDLDSLMRRTRERPFVTGRYEADWIWLSALVIALLLALLAAAVATNWLASFFVFLGAFTYGVIYTVWLKRKTWLNIVIGGLAGSFAILAGAAAAGASTTPLALLFAAILFLWTPPHFWALAFACREDYRAANIPMLPVVIDDRSSTRVILIHAIAVVALSLVPAWYGMHWIYLAGAFAGGSFFILACYRLAANPETAKAWRAFAASIVQLGVLLTAAILDRLLLG